MGFYIGFVSGKALVAREGSFRQVVDWGQSILDDYPIVKIARVRTDLPSARVIADLTKEGISYARTPRSLSSQCERKSYVEAQEQSVKMDVEAEVGRPMYHDVIKIERRLLEFEAGIQVPSCS